MDSETIRALYRFNTFANEALRRSLLEAGDEAVRRPVEMWFGSVFDILAHVASGEATWLGRLRDRQPDARGLSPADFATVGDLVAAWRDLDAQWEAYAGSLSGEALDEEIVARRSDGRRYQFKLWQPVLHVANHSTEHRGHATVAMTQLGISHGDQDFLDQFRNWRRDEG
jgi:uncharacterized damage-inducible protein DinB